MGEVAQLGLNGQQLVQIVQESQTAFIKLVAVFRQLQQGGFPMPCSFSMVRTEEAKDSMR